MVSFSGTCRVSFSVLARILPDPGTSLDSTIYRYSRGFYLIPTVPRILPFIVLHEDSTLFRYLTDQFLCSRTDST